MSNTMKLTRRQFAVALKLGLGRATRYVQEYGHAEVRDIVVWALTHELRFEVNFNAGRSCWIANMLVYASHDDLDFYAAALNYALDKCSKKRDLASMSFMCLEFVRMGFPEFRELMYLKLDWTIDRFSDCNIFGEAIVAMDKEEGVRRVAGIVSAKPTKSLQAENELLRTTVVRIGLLRTIRALQSLENYRPDIRNFVGQFVAKGAAKWSREEFNLESAIANINSGERFSSLRLASFGKKATSLELTAVWNKLCSEKRPRQIAACLQVFTKRPLPFLGDEIFQLAESPHSVIRRAAIAVLENTSDDTIREFARRMLQTKEVERAVEYLYLFGLNYKEGDAQFIQASLRPMRDLKAAHMGCLNLIALGQKVGDKNLTASFIWFYENNPCSFCRESLVAQLIEWGVAPPEMLVECLVDVNDELRDLAEVALMNAEHIVK